MQKIWALRYWFLQFTLQALQTLRSLSCTHVSTVNTTVPFVYWFTQLRHRIDHGAVFLDITALAGLYAVTCANWNTHTTLKETGWIRTKFNRFEVFWELSLASQHKYMLTETSDQALKRLFQCHLPIRHSLLSPNKRGMEKIQKRIVLMKGSFILQHNYSYLPSFFYQYLCLHVITVRRSPLLINEQAWNSLHYCYQIYNLFNRTMAWNICCLSVSQ